MPDVNVLDVTLERYRDVAKAERLERRRKPRIDEPFAARIFGVNSHGVAFNTDCLVDNLSCLGLYLRILQPMSRGSDIRMLLFISEGGIISLKGRVLREESQHDGRHGLAIAIDEYEFL